MPVELNAQVSSSKVIITLISSLLLIILIYPWIIIVSVLFAVVGFSCVEHLDKFVKSSISSGRFGNRIQDYLKEYVSVDGTPLFEKKKEVVDPLRDYLEESQKEEATVQQNACQFQTDILIQETLIIPTRTSSNRSSPEGFRPNESPRSLSAASSRRVSEDISNLIGGSGGHSPHHHRRESHNKTPSPSKSSTAASTPSPSITLNPEIANLRVDQEFKVDVRVDKAFGKLFTRIIDYYISPSWAPYETRRQLKLSLKQLLITVGEEFNRKLISNEKNPPVKLLRQKLAPLLLHYVEKSLGRGLADTEPIISRESKRRLVLKIRKFCRKIFQRFLKKDDKNCKLWTELCIAVLADGVLVNVMDLGKDKLPELLEELVAKFKNYKSNHSTRVSPGSDLNLEEDVHQFSDPLLAPNNVIATDTERTIIVASSISNGDTTNISTSSSNKVPFLLDSFLDPPYNFEKPDPIISRWRPTLKDIISETDLLYPLIQYMKHAGGQQSLAYLQGVLDDFPGEGDPYCRRILELEYLTGFCRSSLFLETMGLSRVEVAMEVGADALGVRRNSGGHIRSASYGGPSSSSFLRIELGVVDGLPLTDSAYQNQNASIEHTVGAALPGAGAVEPSLAFKRRPHLELFIAKFIKSTTKSWMQYYDPLGSDVYEPVKRMGIDAKSYSEWDHPEVNSRVYIQATNSDIYDSLNGIVTSLMRVSPIASPFLSGIANFLKPYVMPAFDDQLEKNLSELLSVDVLVSIVDLISSVYEETGEESSGNENEEFIDFPSLNTQNINLSQDNHQDHTHCTTCDQSIKSNIQSFISYLLESFLMKMIDLDYFVKSCKRNRDYIFLFFVDVLDVLVREILDE